MSGTSDQLMIAFLRRKFVEREELKKITQIDLESRKAITEALGKINKYLAKLTTKEEVAKLATKDDLKNQKEAILDEVDLKLTNLARDIDEKLKKQPEEVYRKVAEYFENNVMPVLNGTKNALPILTLTQLTHLCLRQEVRKEISLG